MDNLDHCVIQGPSCTRQITRAKLRPTWRLPGIILVLCRPSTISTVIWTTQTRVERRQHTTPHRPEVNFKLNFDATLWVKSFLFLLVFRAERCLEMKKYFANSKSSTLGYKTNEWVVTTLHWHYSDSFYLSFSWNSSK